MIKKLMKTIIASFLFFSPFTGFAQDLTIFFEERVPYVEKDNRSVKGLVATPLIKALDKAKINYTLKQKPSKRHLFEIQANQHPICAVGWFKNKQREQYAKYTHYVYQDKPMGVIKRKGNPKVTSSMDLHTLLGQQDIKFLGKKSYSYGKVIDDMIVQYSVKRFDINSDNVNMYTLIAKKRADFMLSTYEEALYLLKTHPLKDHLEFVGLKGMPEGNKRYLICSKKVEDSVIESINKYLP